MNKINKMVNPSVVNVFEYDNTFPIQFCPVCGSENLTSSGREEPLFSCKESWIIRCDNCNWEMEVFVIKKGKKKFKFRHDYQEFYNPKPEGLTNKLRRLAEIIARDKGDWTLPPDDETRLQCGWEDDCKEQDCHKCPKKYKVTLELTEAEICAIEDCAMVDLPQHQKEKPKVYELTQHIMHDLMKKVFKELVEDD